ncbi:hypothetical protein PIB30_029037 [Stylosanthes scabra]|uniref:Uncharacterized protein n=1 Tax=Stylosanthes scabra TaxID=79078 RepID=A0ABU6ZAY0_9FABA|nr:hypothetical protein [Stylosanthes scabra]
MCLLTWCSEVNAEPNKPNPVQAWAIAVNSIAEPSMEQAGGRTCKTLRRSSINVPVVVIVGNARTDVSEECKLGTSPIPMGRRDRATSLSWRARQVGSLLLDRIS